MLSMLSLTAVGAISCGKAVDDRHERTDDTTNDTESTAASEPEETGRAAAKDSLPADLDLGGETIRIVSRNGDTDTAIEFYSDEATGDIVSDAVYNRNMKVSDRLGVISSSFTRVMLQGTTASGTRYASRSWLTRTITIS